MYIYQAVVSLQIMGDAVGWGFVVRGARPCHIQAVEPCGPAAAAGMKVFFPLTLVQFLCKFLRHL